MRRIHPAFKRFIMQDVVKKWDDILKTQGVEKGIEGGVCFTTANTFCKVLEEDFDIPCNIEPVETTIGNEKAKELFDYYLEQGDLKAFWEHLEHVEKTVGKKNLSPKTPVTMGMGSGGKESQFHFIMNLPEQNEIVDLTLSHIKKPKWGINCENYWSKYDRAGYKGGVFHTLHNDAWRRSGCVLTTMHKKTPIRIGIDPAKYLRQEAQIREYMNREVRKRRIPIFLNR